MSSWSGSWEHNLDTLDREQFGQLLIHNLRPHSQGLKVPPLRFRLVSQIPFPVPSLWTTSWKNLAKYSAWTFLPSHTHNLLPGDVCFIFFLLRLPCKIGYFHLAVCFISLLPVPRIHSFSNYYRHYWCLVW